MKPRYFSSPAAFGAWLAKNHASATELWVGFHKKGSGKPSITWPESVDEALCFGWIDGLRKNVDETRYTIRFTPRKPGSVWSAINMRRVEALDNEGRMRPAGLAVYEKRRENKSGIYSYEQRSVALPEIYDRILAKNKTARAFFLSQPPSYRKAACWWVISAKKEATRLSRLERLLAHSADGERLPQYRPIKL